MSWPARYPGVCSECGCRVDVDEEIEWGAGGKASGVRHVRCPEEESLTLARGACPACHLELLPSGACPMGCDT